jgi:hypothetical protein
VVGSTPESWREAGGGFSAREPARELGAPIVRDDLTTALGTNQPWAGFFAFQSICAVPTLDALQLRR